MAQERTETIGPLPFCAVCCASSSSSQSSSSSESESSGSKSSKSISSAAKSSASISSASESCDVLCVSGAGEAQVNGQYTRVSTLIDPCRWDGPNGYRIERNFDGSVNRYVITNGTTVEYETTGTFPQDDCPCPDTFGWTTFSGSAPAPTVERGPCPESSSSSLSSPSEPCDLICVQGAGSWQVNGLYARIDNECEWEGPRGFKILRKTDIDSYVIEGAAGAQYYVTTDTVPDGSCPCPANNTWIVTGVGAGPAPTLTIGPDCPSASSVSSSSEASAESGTPSSSSAGSGEPGPQCQDCLGGAGQGDATVTGTQASLGLDGTYTFDSQSGNTWTWLKGSHGVLQVKCCSGGTYCARLIHNFTDPNYGGDDCDCAGAGWKTVTVSCTGGVLTGSFTLDPRGGASGTASVTL